MDTTTTGDSDGGGCPHLFQSTARFDRVMGDAAYDRRHRNQARGVTKTQQSTMAAGKGKQGDGWHDDGNGRHDDGKGQQGVRRHDDGDGRHDDGKGRQGGRATGGTTMATQSFAHLPGRKQTRATCIRM